MVTDGEPAGPLIVAQMFVVVSARETAGKDHVAADTCR